MGKVPDPIEFVFLHPLPFVGSFWEAFEAEFGGIRSYAPTLYSLGESLEEVARSVLDVVEGSRLVVVGNSIGGSVALEVAAAAPNRVEHLVLIGTKAGHRPEPEYRDWALGLLARGGVAAVWDEVWSPLFGAGASPNVVEEARSAALAVPCDSLAAGIEMFHRRRDLDGWISGWEGPLMVVSGQHDKAPEPRVGREMAHRARRGMFTIVPDCGHYVPIEQPEILTSILTKVVDAKN